MAFDGAFDKTTAAAETPFDLTAAKEWVRQLHTVGDATITQLIKAVTAEFENKTGHTLVESEYTWKLDSLPSNNGPLVPPMCPLVSITSFSYTDENGDAQTFDHATKCDLDTLGMPGRIALKYEEDWPDLRSGIIQPVTIVFKAGHNGSANVPAEVLPCLKLLLGHFYNNREAVLTGTIGQELPYTTQQILNSMRIDY